MNMDDIKNYVEEHRRFEMPNFQEKFSLSYTEANKALEGLVKGGVIKFCDGFTYEVVQVAGEVKTEPVYIPKDDQEAFLIRALWECVKSGNASTSLIQRRLSCGYAMAARAIDWMEENDFVGSHPNRKVKMSVEEYYAKFGNPGREQEQSEDEERERYIEERRRALMERLSRMSDDEDDNSDEDDESDDEDDDEQARREYLEKRRAELIARMRQSCNDDDEDVDAESEDDDEEDEQDDNTVDLRAVLIECLERGLQDKSNNDKFILGLNGEPKFELKFVNDGKSLTISDCGKTVEQVSQTKRKISNVLKSFAPVRMDEEEISITIDNPYGTLMALLTLYSAIEAIKKMK